MVVASVRAAAVRMHGPRRFLANCLELKTGDDYSPELAREFLREAGYVEDDPVTEPGEFSVRGGILDVFPPHLDNPVRLEFFGDQLESLRAFDVETQRSVATAERAPDHARCASRPRARGILKRWAEDGPGTLGRAVHAASARGADAGATRASPSPASSSFFPRSIRWNIRCSTI